MNKAEAPGGTYWKDITRYDRLIEARLAYTTGRFVLGVFGNRTHNAQWEASTLADKAFWLRPERRCLGLPVDEGESCLIIYHNGSVQNHTVYKYKPVKEELTVVHKGDHPDITAGTIITFDESMPGGPATFTVPEVSGKDYDKLHRELAYGADLPGRQRG